MVLLGIVMSVAKKFNPLNLINLLFPESCRMCNAVCQQCICPQCLAPFKSLNWKTVNGVNTVSDYHEGIFKDVLHEIKFNRNKRLGTVLGTSIATHIPSVPYIDAIWIPVPFHHRRIESRGFNVLNVLFNPLLKRFNIKSHDVLCRIHATPHLHGLTRNKRFELMANCFGLAPTFQPHLITNRQIVIYDDIVTTGATIQSIRVLLEPFQPKSCHVVALSVTGLTVTTV
jgi:ComF family protein